MNYAIPVKPHAEGSIAPTFGGPAQSPRDVLVRARAALAPRGAWSASGWTTQNHEGVGRCVLQAIKDVDGVHQEAARHILGRIVEEETSFKDVIAFNDSAKTHKHDVLRILDIAIERCF